MGNGTNQQRVCLVKPVMAAQSRKMTVTKLTAFSASNLSLVMFGGFHGYPALLGLILQFYIQDKTIY